jgi:hypothetical protein
VLEVHGVGPGQTIVMNGDDQLVIDTPAAFAGTIQAKAGDTFFLGGVVATTATLQGQTLLLQNAGQTVKALALSGSYAGDAFAVSAFGGTNTQVRIVGSAVGATGAASANPGAIATGQGSGSQSLITPDSLNITTTAPSSFIASGVDSGASGNGVDGGSGSKFLIGATPGNDQFAVDVRNLTSGIFSTIANFHSGDSATILGVSLADFNVNLFNDVGAPGFTGLTFAFDQPGHPMANVVLAGYSIADLTNGRLSQTLGITPDPQGGPGTPFLTIHGN